MALTDLTFDPSTGWNDTTSFPTTPASETEVRERMQELHDQTRDFINDTLISELGSVEEGASGADNIGSAPIDGVEVSEGVAATTVRDQIVAVKAIADTAAAGEFTPGIIDNSNLFGTGVVNNAAMAANSVDSDQYVDGSIDTEHYSDGSVTKAKFHADALDWSLIATSGVLTGASTLAISTQAGKSEIMLQFRESTGADVIGVVVVPLDSSGLIIGSGNSTYVLGFSTSVEFDYRKIGSNSATELSISTSFRVAQGGSTFLQKLYVYTR